mmetsp:Transcript_16031/g.53876  ORF Transcript_16031/g.53876 Transcript_16031/m.53876 type:complete len:351 (+) Transcript_16031:356-1408(+)
MMVLRTTSIPSFSASARVAALGAMLKATTTAPDTDASCTSSSVRSPAPARSTRQVAEKPKESERSRPSMAPRRASAEPCTSALMTTSMVSFLSSRATSPKISPRRARDCAAKSAAARSSRSRCWRTSAICRACCSLPATRSESPARGTPWNPSTSTGAAGPASSTSWPLMSNLRTRPHSEPATTISPARRVPRSTMVVATGPRPRSMRASTTVPSAGRAGLARRSRSSAWRVIFSSRSSRFWRSVADTCTESTSPPNSSRTTSCSRSSRPTRLGSAPGLSILLMATIMGHRAALAALMASTVCCLTPSSAATTRTTTSVTLAPRERMAEKAACPGVSRKVILSPAGVVIW